MSDNYHTPIATTAPANAATFNSPLGELDSAITGFADGSNSFSGVTLESPTTKTIASGVLTTDKSFHLVESESGTTDSIDTITTSNQRLLFLKAANTHSITFASGGNVNGIKGLSSGFSGNTIVCLLCNGGQWYVIGSTDAEAVTYLPDIISDWNSSTDPGSVGDALDQLASRTKDLESAVSGGIAILRDEKSSGTLGGSASATTWNARNLNTEVSDTNGIVSIASNRFLPIAGNYYLRASAPGYECGRHRLRLFNVTDNSSVEEGPIAITTGSSTVGNNALLNVIFTANGTDEYRIDHYTTVAQASNGLGDATSDGTNEVFLEIVLEKLG